MNRYAQAGTQRLRDLTEQLAQVLEADSKSTIGTQRVAAGAEGLVITASSGGACDGATLGPAVGIEPTTPALRKPCSTVELRRPGQG